MVTSCISVSMFDFSRLCLKATWTMGFGIVFFNPCLAQVDSTQSAWTGPSLWVEDMPQEVAAIMERQQFSWNNGDIDQFMKGYWESDSLMFVGKNGVTFGFEETLARYKTGYPDGATMGRLSFTNRRWIGLGQDAGWLLGSWQIEREGGEDSEGMYTLLWRHLNGRWVIVADHSS